MQVVLREDVDHLGLRGEVVTVARGYARNFLLPRGLAEVATPGLVRELERRDALRARHEATSNDEARTIADRLEKVELRFEVNAGPTGSLFGSVTATNVADRLWEDEKIRIDRRKLGLQTIKRIGRYTVPVEVFQDVTADLRVLVVPEGGELPPEEELEAAAEAPAAEPDAAEREGAEPEAAEPEGAEPEAAAEPDSVEPEAAAESADDTAPEADEEIDESPVDDDAPAGADADRT
jgi:large subunit ribosomal protein L9